MLVFLFICTCLCEMFEFTKPKETLRLMLRLDPDNINTGFFKPLPGSNMTYKIEIRAISSDKILYKANSLDVDKETHFSFNNTTSLDVVLSITSILVDPNESHTAGMIHMKFESTFDTFNLEVSKKTQIEPAIYALEQLLKKVSNVTMSSRMVVTNLGKISAEGHSMRRFVLLFSFFTLAAYIVFNSAQLYYTKAYLNEKKLL